MRTLISAVLLGLAVLPVTAMSNEGLRVLPVRELAVAEFPDKAFSFKLLKIRGYSVDIRMAGQRRMLKIGQSFAPEDAGCTLIFKKISPETRIARFATDCR
ncbi:MAG: hypothetical protein AAGH68_15535 [Pseudomonadota bacterium]